MSGKLKYVEPAGYLTPAMKAILERGEKQEKKAPVKKTPAKATSKKK